MENDNNPIPPKRSPLIDAYKLEKETLINNAISSVCSDDVFENRIASFIGVLILQAPKSQMLDVNVIEVFIAKKVPERTQLKEYLYFAYEFLTLCEEWKAASDFEKVTNIKFSPINHSASQWTEEDLENLRIYFKDDESWENPFFNSPLKDPMGLRFLEENQNLTKELCKKLKKEKKMNFPQS